MAETAAGKLYTLTEVSKITNISMPTLQRYKKAYQDRIPSTGEGRRQRYPEGPDPLRGRRVSAHSGRPGRCHPQPGFAHRQRFDPVQQLGECRRRDIQHDR